MSYTQHGLIEAADYNTYVGTSTSVVANTLNTVNSAGNKKLGYGQSSISLVASGTAPISTVSATAWNALINKISDLAKHQGTPITAVTLTAAGNPVAVVTTTSPVTSVFQNNINAIYAGANNAIAQSAGTLTQTTKSDAWYNHAGFTHVITFASGDHARYFFNAGGQISLNFTHPAGDSTNNLWNALALACGKIVLSSPNSGTVSIAGSTYSGITKVGGTAAVGSSVTLSADTGYYALNTSDTVVFKQSASLDTGAVGAITVSMKSNGSRGINGDVGNIITVTTKWDRIPEGFAADGTYPKAGTTAILTVTSPSTTYLTNTWGTPAVVGTVITGLDKTVTTPTVTASWFPNPITIPGSSTLTWVTTNATKVTLGSTAATEYPANSSKLYTDLGPKKYTYTDGFSQEFDIVGTDPGQPLWIAQQIGTRFFESTDEFITTGGGKRYGLYRYPEPEGIVSWLAFCTANLITDPATNQKFIDAFFITTLGANAIAGNPDSERSFQSSKAFSPGDAWGNFVTRPPNSGWWGIDPYSYTSGWLQEFPGYVTNLTLAKKIADNFYRGMAAFKKTSVPASGYVPAQYVTRYGLGRKPDAAGLDNWVNWCLTPSRNGTGTQVQTPETNQTFIDTFFNLGDGADLERSKLQVKTFDNGGGFGDFYDRPIVDPSKMFNTAKTFNETITAVGPGGTTTITI